eukprot:20101-Heterococcus_DN1.PRE.3
MEVPAGTGTGFVWDKQGHIVTNFHVIRSANTAQIRLTDAKTGKQATYSARVQGYDPDKDVHVPLLRNAGSTWSCLCTAIPVCTSMAAQITTLCLYQPQTAVHLLTVPQLLARAVPLTSQQCNEKHTDADATSCCCCCAVSPPQQIAVLQIDASPASLTPIELGSSGILKVGQLALAIGNPFGLDHTLTTGVISGLGREVRSPSGRPISNVIQTDAAINPVFRDFKTSTCSATVDAPSSAQLMNKAAYSATVYGQQAPSNLYKECCLTAATMRLLSALMRVGNSGGPLLNSAGQIVGMNTAIYSTSGAFSALTAPRQLHFYLYFFPSNIRCCLMLFADSHEPVPVSDGQRSLERVHDCARSA